MTTFRSKLPDSIHLFTSSNHVDTLLKQKKINFQSNKKFTTHKRATKKQPDLAFRSKKAGRFEKLLGFARSHSIVARGSVSLS